MLNNELDLTAAAYFLTTFEGEQHNFDSFYIDCEGTRKRGLSREVLGTNARRTVLGSQVFQLLALQLSKNGIFHLLPESLFIPLTLGNASSNYHEVIDEIRKNRKREKDSRLFFAPFDTEFFLWNAKLLNRHLKWPYDEEAKDVGIIINVADKIAGISLDLERPEYLIWLSLLANIEEAKENPQLLGEYLTLILKEAIEISPIPSSLENAPFVPLGETRLAADTVLSGAVVGEEEDWLIEVFLKDQAAIDKEMGSNFLREMLLEMLDFFVAAAKQISIRFIVDKQEVYCELGQHVLGVNAFVLAENRV